MGTKYTNPFQIQTGTAIYISTKSFIKSENNFKS